MDKQKDFEKGWEEHKAKKKKEIEEMAKTECVSKRKCNKDCSIQDEGLCDIYDTCETLYNAGYRKIPENAVVLTREEYGSLVTRPSLNTAIDVFEVRKETAEKFAKRLKEDVSEDNELHEALNAYLKRDYFEYIDEIAKEFTEGKV